MSDANERTGEDQRNGSESIADADDIAPAYDFSRGERGKHAAAMRNGYTMVIHRGDGVTAVRGIAPRPGTVVLDPDVRAYFPDSEAVNRALRELIGLLPRRDELDDQR